MANSSKLSQAFQDQLEELEQIMEREKVELTPEVEAYFEENIQRISKMVSDGQMPSKEDLNFFKDVKMWIGCGPNIREVFPDIKSMKDQQPEADKRNISLKQWLDLLHLERLIDRGEIPGMSEIDRIDFEYYFGDGRIIAATDVELPYEVQLYQLPDGFGVATGGIQISDCTHLRGLPKDLFVDENLCLRKNISSKVRKDAEDLLNRGRIRGRIIFDS